MEKKLADGRILRNFAIGQLGWAILSGVVSNWLLYFYMPSEETIAAGMPLFITQGIVFAGMTVIGLITALCRLVDGFIDPFIASRSDSLNHPLGRRIPFLRWFAIPFGLMTVIVFTLPGLGSEAFNDVALLVCLVLFYVTLSLYCTPFNALIPELGRTQELRVNLSTFISVTYFVGTATAYLVPTIAGLFEGLLASPMPTASPLPSWRPSPFSACLCLPTPSTRTSMRRLSPPRHRWVHRS